MDEIKTKEQIAKKLQEVSKILVTVSDSPSVDALSAALALAMILEKAGKYATAIFSGRTPPAIAFLEPEKTFDDTTDSLRDFIIALNKDKADHLRYKIDGDVVKVFITPYKSTITEEDLVFSQGDYNVELVIALGVDDHESLDKALENHGQILHDATIITITAGEQTSTLGGIDWHDTGASSLCEMVTGVAEMIKDDKSKSLLDSTIATALLTGIVAETERFSNEHTTSKVMGIASNLMTAGADQQLIASELQKDQAVPEGGVNLDNPGATGSAYSEGGSESADNLNISHDGETLQELEKRVGSSKADAQNIPEPSTHATISHAYLSDESIGEDLGTNDSATVAAPTNSQNNTPSPQNSIADSLSTAITQTSQSSDVGSPQGAYAFDEPQQPVAPASPSPADLGLPMPPPLPDFSAINQPGLQAQPTQPPAILGDILAPDPTLTPDPTLNVNTLPVTDIATSAPSAPPAPTTPPMTAPTAQEQPNPGQFQIPGQQ